MRVELISQRMTAPSVFVRYQLNVMNELPPPLWQLSLNHIHGCCVKSLQSEDKLPKHLIQWGRSHQAKLILLAFVPLEWGQSPWVTLQKNLREIWSRNMSIDCGFMASDTPIYASSLNMCNNLLLWASYSIQLNALTKEKSIGRSSGAACDWVNAPLVLIPAVVLHLFEWSFPGKSIRPSLCLSLAPRWWWQEFHCLELRPMMDQKFLKIP